MDRVDDAASERRDHGRLQQRGVKVAQHHGHFPPVGGELPGSVRRRRHDRERTQHVRPVQLACYVRAVHEAVVAAGLLR